MTNENISENAPAAEITEAEAAAIADVYGNSDTEHQDAAGDNTDTEAEPDATSAANREAAKYRRKLRTAEAERDQLRERVAVMQRGEVERLAASVLADPADLWHAASLVELLADDGTINTHAVMVAATKLAESKPHWKRPLRQRSDPSALKSGASGIDSSVSTSWQQALSS